MKPSTPSTVNQSTLDRHKVPSFLTRGPVFILFRLITTSGERVDSGFTFQKTATFPVWAYDYAMPVVSRGERARSCSILWDFTISREQGLYRSFLLCRYAPALRNPGAIESISKRRCSTPVPDNIVRNARWRGPSIRFVESRGKLSVRALIASANGFVASRFQRDGWQEPLLVLDRSWWAFTRWIERS